MKDVVGGKIVWFLKLVVDGEVLATDRVGPAKSITVVALKISPPDRTLEFRLLAITDDGRATIRKYQVEKEDLAIILSERGPNILNDVSVSDSLDVFSSIFLLEETTSRAAAGGAVSVYAVTAESDGWVRSRGFSENGKLTQVGDPVELFEHGDAIQSLDPVDLPTGGRGPDAAVVWTKAISPT